jgi:hypothetical protein
MRQETSRSDAFRPPYTPQDVHPAHRLLVMKQMSGVPGSLALPLMLRLPNRAVLYIKTARCARRGLSCPGLATFLQGFEGTPSARQTGRPQPG